MRGLLVGRFQPFHRGHLEVIRAIERERPGVPLMLAIGSAEESYTWKNPFTAGERYEMTERALPRNDHPRVEIVPVADIRRHAQWVRYLESLLPAFDRVYTNNPLTRLLFERGGYAVEHPPWFERRRFEGEHVRRQLAADRGWKPLVPPPVATYLTELKAPSRLALLRARDTPGSGGSVR
jgi:nicotinamide-nucleotide adenylyltransferase